MRSLPQVFLDSAVDPGTNMSMSNHTISSESISVVYKFVCPVDGTNNANKMNMRKLNKMKCFMALPVRLISCRRAISLFDRFQFANSGLETATAKDKCELLTLISR